jgi:hypothetical protein
MTSAPQLAGLRAQLGRRRERAPLFDTQRFTAHLEAVYAHMHQRCLSGQAPQTFHIERRAGAVHGSQV